MMISMSGQIADMRHLALSPQNLVLRRIFPWAFSVQKILHADRSIPFSSDHLFVGSDYSGDHKGCRFATYAYLIVDGRPASWITKQREIRARYLPNSRRMSFKRLGDPARLAALPPLLAAADTLNGHLVVLAVHKSVRLHPSRKSDVHAWNELLQLSGKWNHRALEAALRKAHFFSLIVAQWTRPAMDVTWISDQDESVANFARLDDSQKLAARLSTLYLPHKMHEFAMNTTEVDGPGREFEDLLAIPDLAAGMIAELSTALSKHPIWLDTDSENVLHEGEIKAKSELLADWFWNKGSKLRRTCIVMDRVGTKSRVFRLG